MSDAMRQIRDAVESEISTELGASYSKLPYVEVIEKNSFRTNNNRYGVRALVSSEIPGVTKYTTFTQSFEMVLTKGYVQSTIDDTEQVEGSYDLRALILDIYTRLVNNKAGIPALTINVTNLVVSEPEYLEDDKVVIIRSTFDIIYRLTL